MRFRGNSLKRMLRGSSRNINCWKFSSLRTGHATQPTRGAGKRKKVFVVLRDKIFFPRARWTFFFDLYCTVDTCSVVFIYHARLRDFAREKNVEKSFRSFVSIFSSRLPPWALHGMTAWNSFLAQKFVKSFLSERETTSALN